jgi:hypothetical protein
LAGPFRLLVKLVRITRHGVVVRARLIAAIGTPGSDWLSVSLVPPGKHARRVRVATVKLSGGAWHTFTLHLALARADRLVLRVAPDKAIGLPALQADVRPPHGHAAHRRTK